MINGGKIGVGIVTFNRPQGLLKLHRSLPKELISEFVIVDDGDWCEEFNQIEDYSFWIHTQRSGVGKAKNAALKYLLEKKCDHIFLIEDDIFIKDPQVFEKYIEASKVSGIQHFNYSQHGMMNKAWPEGVADPLNIIDYKTSQIALYRHCVGAFSYYSKKCLDKVGLLDERYYNACEHVDHTYEIIKVGMHPPFWFFADIHNSWEYLGDEEWSLTQSTISSNPKHQEMVQKADAIFVEKHGHLPGHTPLTSDDDVIKSLKEIKKTYGK